MRASNFIDVLAALLTVALVTTLVSHPATAGIISNISNGFTNAIKAAMGR
jgi:hypothetical protein